MTLGDAEWQVKLEKEETSESKNKWLYWKGVVAWMGVKKAKKKKMGHFESRRDESGFLQYRVKQDQEKLATKFGALVFFWARRLLHTASSS